MRHSLALVFLLFTTYAMGKDAAQDEEWIKKPFNAGEIRLIGFIGHLDSTPESQDRANINAGVAKGKSIGVGAEYVLNEEWVAGAFVNNYRYQELYKDVVDRSFGAYLSQAIYTDDLMTVYGSGGLSYHDFRLFTGSVKNRVGYFDAAIGTRGQIIEKIQLGFETKYSVIVNPIKGVNIDYKDETLVKSFKFRTWQFALQLVYLL